ncbi:MAG: tRNA (adenosine(37)-N6)-dimethylallyltransferase MiaA [Candidatus Zixiibacteriota bacterium]
MPEPGRIPVICGPTGSGKTSLALRLAEDFPIEIISADSRQLIRHLDIGTAKPTPGEQERVRFHLIDLIEPGERFSSFQFIEAADAAVGDILVRRRLPVVVGGTGLYLRALIDGVVEMEADRPEIRERLEADMQRLGPEAMHRRLTGIDPQEAARVHPHNRVRLVRALEIYELTGTPKSKLTSSGAYKKSQYEYGAFCLMPDRAQLYRAIEARVDLMMRLGLLAEVDNLLGRGFGAALRRANVIGYDELLDYREGRCSLAEAVALIKQNSRRYAKRQITWFRHQLEGEYFPSGGSVLEAVRAALETRPRRR